MLEMVDIHKRFTPGKAVLQGVSLALAREEIVCLLGPSGCGKSTLLRIIAGLERADRGQVRLEGVEIGDLPAHRRGIGLMFQDYALFPHLDVAANVGYGLRMQGMPTAQRRARVDEMLALVNLTEYAARAVDDLSGGEQQRVALARTLAPNPALLLLDEPVANLDRLLREELVQELRRILKTLHMTDDLRDARPGGGVCPGRPHRCDARRTHRAGGRAAAALPASRQYLCRGVFGFSQFVAHHG